jgi:hypothetical protein
VQTKKTKTKKQKKKTEKKKNRKKKTEKKKSITFVSNHFPLFFPFCFFSVISLDFLFCKRGRDSKKEDEKAGRVEGERERGGRGGGKKEREREGQRTTLEKRNETLNTPVFFRLPRASPMHVDADTETTATHFLRTRPGR